MKEMLAKDLEESQGGKCSEVLSATELRVQLVQKEQELARAKEALQGERRVTEHRLVGRPARAFPAILSFLELAPTAFCPRVSVVLAGFH